MITGYFTKIVVALALFGLVGFDGVSVLAAKVNAQDTANTAALEASEAYAQNHDLRGAYAAASGYAEEHGATVDPKTFRVDPDGRVHLRMEKDATTLLLYRTGRTKKWAHVVATGTGQAV